MHKFIPMAMLVIYAGLAVGCSGKYTIRFQTADVINAPGNDLTREELDVDVVLLTPKDSARYPQLLDGSVRSDQWFKARDTNSGDFAGIAPERIFAFRRGSSDSSRDNRQGDPLLSRIDSSTPVSLKIEHPNPGDGKAAILVYGRFRAMDGMAKAAPVIINPPPGAGKTKELDIYVDRQGMRCTNCP